MCCLQGTCAQPTHFRRTLSVAAILTPPHPPDLLKHAANCHPSFTPAEGRAILLVVFPVIGFFCILSLALYCAQLVRNRAAQRRLGSNYLLNLAAMHDVVTAIQRRQQQQQSSAAALGGSGTSGASQRLVVLTRRPGTSNPQPPLQLDDAAAAALAAAVLGSNQRGVREALRRLYVQHRLMEDPGYQLTSWADVQLAWAVWAAEVRAAWDRPPGTLHCCCRGLSLTALSRLLWVWPLPPLVVPQVPQHASALIHACMHQLCCPPELCEDTRHSASGCTPHMFACGGCALCDHRAPPPRC